MKYAIEVTDTFGGELNYSWVRRYEIDAPDTITTRALVRRAKAAAGLSGRHTTDDYGDSLTVRFSGACIAMTVDARP